MLYISIEGAVLSDSGPTATWQRLFGTFVPDDPIAQKRKNLEAGIIDRVRGDFDQVLTHPRLSTVDRDRLTGHMELLHDLHQRLLALGKACSLPDAPTDPAMDNETGLDEVTALNIALITAGLACDRTRIAVIQLGVGTDYRFDHHNVQHSASTPEGFEKYTQIHRHYGDQLAALLHAMDSVVEDPTEGTTLLDNSVVLFCNEDGTSNDGHIGPAMPAVLAGGCGGYFRTGRYLDVRPEIQIQDGAEVGLPHAGVFGSVYTASSDFRGRLYNSLLLSIIDAMGDTPPEGGIGSYQNPYAESDAYDLEAARKPLPHLKA
jgi:hypothetical protein